MWGVRFVVGGPTGPAPLRGPGHRAQSATPSGGFAMRGAVSGVGPRPSACAARKVAGRNAPPAQDRTTDIPKKVIKKNKTAQGGA